MDDDNNININNEREIEITNEQITEDKFINPESERIKLDKEKENEISTTPKDIIIQVEQEIKKEEQEEEIKIEEKDEEIEEDENSDLNDDILKIENKSINIYKIKADEILKETQLEPKENLDLLKIELIFSGKKEFKWEVYRTPKETKEFFKKLYKSIQKDKTVNNSECIGTLSELKEIKDENIVQIKEELEKIIKNEYFKDNVIINEFLNIGGSSFSIYNNGIKPFEGWVGKKADPHCLRKVFAVACKCLECWIFKQ